MSSRQERQRDGWGSIHEGEVLPLREAARRLGWGQKTIRAAQRAGLRTIAMGRLKYIVGSDLLKFFGQQRDGNNKGGDLV